MGCNPNLFPSLHYGATSRRRKSSAVPLKIRTIKNAASVSEGRFELISLLQP
jgi:hypothetical protein